MMFSRFLLPENLTDRATIQPLSDEPLRRYLGTNPESKSVNLHPLLAHYFQTLVFDQQPNGVPADAWEAFRQSAFWRALYGHGVVLRQRDFYLAIDSRFYWPVLVQGRKVGSIVVFPFRRDPGYDGSQVNVPDRAIVMIVNDADPRGIIQIREWSGVTLGPIVDQQTISPMRMAVWGDGVGEFTLAGIWVLDEVSARMAGISNILKRFESPHLQAPASAIKYDEDGRPSLGLNQGSGSVLPVQPNDKDWKYVTLDSENPLHRFEIDFLLRVIAGNTGMPLNVLGGEGIGSAHPRLDSAEGIQAENSVTNARIAVMQAQITNAAAALGLAFTFEQAERERQNEQR